VILASPSSAAAAARVYDLALERAGAGKAGPGSTAGAQLCVGLYRPAAYDLRVAPMDLPRISINLKSVPVAGSIGDCDEREYAGRRYSLFFTPAGVKAHWSKRAPSRHLNIYFQPSVLDDVCDGRAADILDEPRLDLQCPALRPYVDALEQIIGRDEPFARDAVTNLALLILAEFAKALAHPAPALGSSALAAVRDYVATYLDGPLPVADLAAIAGLSAGRFAIAFRAATGSPPHRYVLGRRVVRALELLRVGKLDLAEVALACGFSSQQHMTTTLQRVTGTTPARVRKTCGIPARVPVPLTERSGAPMSG
jgi:AraC family transcriptional regulator